MNDTDLLKLCHAVMSNLECDTYTLDKIMELADFTLRATNGNILFLKRGDAFYTLSIMFHRYCKVDGEYVRQYCHYFELVPRWSYFTD